jgi:hypothetical protein
VVRQVAYSDGVRLTGDAFVPDVDVVISGSEIETSLGTNCDVEAAGGVVLERAIAKSCIVAPVAKE